MNFKIAVGALLYLAMVGPGHSAGKRDVFGLTTGMPQEQVTKLVSERGWSCKDPQNWKDPFGPPSRYQVVISVECRTKEGQQVKIYFASALPGVPTMRIAVSFVAGGTQSVLASLKEQYGPNAREPYPWDLGNGDELRLMSADERNFTVELSNDRMRIENDRAAEAKENAARPAPKF
ncbi:hypothetical protein [Bradyrhizobium diazoefficiens]|uniref:hypothetical protein n=1 Tax=Bradyrhizobium diazoefficiens TaxID=1355477 RepID=UPI00348A8787